MKKNCLIYLAFLALVTLLFVGCRGSDTLYLSGEKDVLIKILDIKENQMVQKFIYNGTDLIFDYPLESKADMDRVKYQLLLATRDATFLKVSASVVQSGNVVPLGSDILEVKGNKGKKFTGIIRGQKLKTAPGDILRFTMSNTGFDEAVIFLTPVKKDASFIQANLH